MNIFLNDLKHACRSLLRSPGFTLAAVITLALGIGANSAMYSVMDRVLGPLPYKDQDRLTVILREDPRQMPASVPFSAPVFGDFQREMNQAEAMTAFTFTTHSLSGDSGAQQITAARVTSDFFRVAGFQPALGRVFLPEEDAESAPGNIILDHKFWQRRFGGDPAILGRSIRLDGRDVTVIGIMGASFDLFSQLAGINFDAIEPMAFTARERQGRGYRSFFVFMRLKPGVSMASATQEARRIHAGLNERYPGSADKDYLPRVAPIKEAMGAMLKPPILALLGLVGFILLIACTNLSNLLLARGFSRQRELTICAAMGASRRDLMNRLLAEGVLLGVVGGACALLAAHGLLGLLTRQLASVNLGAASISATFGLNPRIVAFNFLLMAVSVLVFSLIPAWQASRVQAADTLKEGSKGSASGGQRRLRNVLVVFEVALAMILLVGAGLMLRSLWATSRIHPGFDTQHFLTVQFTLPPAKFPTPDARLALLRALLDRVGATPGIRLATLTNTPPLQNNGNDTSYQVEGLTPPEGGYTNALYHNVAPGYFRTMGIPLLRGQDFQVVGEDTCIINETMARLRWPGQDPVGKRLSTSGSQGPWITVAGVAANVQQIGLGSPDRTQIYFPSLSAGGMSYQSLCIRTEGAPMTVLPSLRQAFRALDPDIPLANPQTGEELIRASLMLPSILGILFTGFGLLGLLLASFGLYGLMSFVVGQRTKEIGIRMALGGQIRNVVGEIVWRGLVLTSFGLGIGVLVAVALGRAIASQLYGVSASDPLVMAISALVLGLVAMLATLIPALRAARINPVVALRNE